MRAPRFRPQFDHLDSRIALDGSTVAVGVAIGTTVLNTVATFTPPLTTIVNWNVTGNPPSTIYNPLSPPISCTSVLIP